MNLKPVRFIVESIEVHFNKTPLLEKKPECPDSFIWRGNNYPITEVLSEWVDYNRRGRMARNMKPTHSKVASHRGSWGVGCFYFRVRTETGKIFELYYDRAPKDVNDRKGDWYLYRELLETQ